jgi:hypothetical protein
LGQIHIRKSHFEDEERLWEWGDFADKERLRGVKRIRGKNFGQIHIMKSHFEDEERLRGKKRKFGANTY